MILEWMRREWACTMRVGLGNDGMKLQQLGQRYRLRKRETPSVSSDLASRVGVGRGNSGAGGGLVVGSGGHDNGAMPRARQTTMKLVRSTQGVVYRWRLKATTVVLGARSMGVPGVDTGVQGYVTALRPDPCSLVAMMKDVALAACFN